MGFASSGVRFASRNAGADVGVRRGPGGPPHKTWIISQLLIQQPEIKK
jgi:hypothetical protein